MLNLPHLCERALPYPHPMEAFAADVGDSHGNPQRNGANKSVAAERQPRILVVGDDPLLQYTRCKVLESAGYAVESAKSTLILEELFLGGLELVLLCHTLSEELTTYLVEAFARLAPRVRVLRISFLSNPLGEKGPTAFVQARPTALLDAVAATLSYH